MGLHAGGVGSAQFHRGNVAAFGVDNGNGGENVVHLAAHLPQIGLAQRVAFGNFGFAQGGGFGFACQLVDTVQFVNAHGVLLMGLMMAKPAV